MRRVFWLVVGLAAGLGLAVYGLNKARAARRAVSPQGLAATYVKARSGAEGLLAEIREAAELRESQLRASFMKDD